MNFKRDTRHILWNTDKEKVPICIWPSLLEKVFTPPVTPTRNAKYVEFRD